MCTFCKIINKEQPAKIFFENDKVVVFYDINPKAPVHILIVSKKHIASINSAGEDERDIIAEMLLVAPQIAREHKIDDGYKLIFNVGKKGGQIIDHLHLHLLGGF